MASLALTLAGVGLCAIVLGAYGGFIETALPECWLPSGIGGFIETALPWVALALACVGNALFHLSAGKAVLDAHEGRGGPIGLFISTGALGLFAGMKLAVGCGLWCCLGFGVALAVVGGWAEWRLFGRAEARSSLNSLSRLSSSVSRPHLSFVLILAALFALAAWRSWAGLLAGVMNAASYGTGVLMEM